MLAWILGIILFALGICISVALHEAGHMGAAKMFGMRVRRYALRSGSGGAGAAPGGDGIERELEMLEDVTVSLITERRDSQPWGLAGGEAGAPGENWLLPGGDESRARRLPDKCTVELRAGDVLRMLTPGGGGWGQA